MNGSADRSPPGEDYGTWSRSAVIGGCVPPRPAGPGIGVQWRQPRGTGDDAAGMTLAPSLVDLLQAFDLPSRLVAGEECLGNGGEVRAGRGLEFHRSGPIDCESDQRRSRTGLAGPALSFCGISCRSILLRKSRRGGMADAEDLKSSGRKRPCGFDSHRRYSELRTVPDPTVAAMSGTSGNSTSLMLDPHRSHPFVPVLSRIARTRSNPDVPSTRPGRNGPSPASGAASWTHHQVS